LVAGSAARTLSWSFLNSASAVVTIFSISELACASIKGSVLISTARLRIKPPACFRAASAARASIHALWIARDSISAL